MKLLKQISVFISIFIFIIAINLVPIYANNERSQEVNKYIEMLNSKSYKTRVDAAKYVSRSGLTDTNLFNVIREKLLSRYNTTTTNHKHIDEMSWLCKALAASGSEEYVPTFNKIIENATSEKLIKYAKQSLALLPEYAERNKIMNETKNYNSNLSNEVNRLISMLQSDNINLKRDAAKTIYRGHYSEKELYEALNGQLLRWYKTVSSTDRHGNDTIAWMCKALAASGMIEYRSTLNEIYENTMSVTVKKHIKKSLKTL